MDEAAPQGGGGAEAGPPTAELVETIRGLLDEAAHVSRELGHLAEDMAAQSEAGRREARRLIAAIGEATAALADRGGIEPEAGTEAGGRPMAEPEPEPAAETASGSDGARLLARQMLANGSERGTVERTLRSSFGIEDADQVLDSILGARN